ncbi:KxYKxGKxW signal peptide domain-containing protein [Leuconostoc falkenbergense]|uniref:KxYKxGKxW signal peptide domain-containing protein n=1 Tax=Leuconostoc falkenbergense TaxID=2766470 RepID=UPI002FCA4C54
MENSKTYKLYKSGKLWVVGAVAVAGVAVSANTTQVSAKKHGANNCWFKCDTRPGKR